MNDANNAGIDAALKAIEDLRISGAGNFFDPKYAGQRGIDRADALRDAYQAVKALSTPNTPVEQREAIARALCCPEGCQYPDRCCSLSVQRLAHNGKQLDAILAVRLDEAAIRKDEREKCLSDLQRSYPDHAWLNAACAAIRNGGKQP